MKSYSIPRIYFPGFQRIISLSQVELSELSSLIENLKVGESLQNVLIDRQDFQNSLSNEDIHDIFRSLISLVGIFESSKRDIDDFTTRFSDSYLISNDSAEKDDGIILKKNLSVLLKNFDSIRISTKAQEIILENTHNFSDSRIVSDIRLVFDSQLNENKKYAVIVHSLKLEYTKKESLKELFIALDLSDLETLKQVIDRAIEKDFIIREGNHNFDFIEIQ